MDKKDFIYDDFDFEGDDVIDNTPPPSGKKHFAHLQMYVRKVTKSYIIGDAVTIPGVIGGDHKDKDKDGNMLFKGWTSGHTGKNKANLYVLVATKDNKEGDPFQIVKQYSSRQFDKDKGHHWRDSVYPELDKLTKPQQKQLIAEGIYATFDDLPTGDVFESDDGPVDICYWGNIEVFPSKEAMEKAQTEFFDQFGDNRSNSKEDFWPASWVESNQVQEMVDYTKTLVGQPHAEIAKAIQLNDALTVDGQPVNVAKVLSHCLDIPEPMIQL